MALPLAWADATLLALGRRLASQPVLLALALLSLVGWRWRARLPLVADGGARWMLGLAPAMAVVIVLDALVVEPLGVAWLPADRSWTAFTRARAGRRARIRGARRGARAPGHRRRARAGGCVPLAWGPEEPGLTLWPRPRVATGAEVTRGLRMDALWEAIRRRRPAACSSSAPGSRSTGGPSGGGPTRISPRSRRCAPGARTSAARSRTVAGGGARLHGLGGSASPAMLAEQRDGRSLVRPPARDALAGDVQQLARSLGIGLVVASRRTRARPVLTESQSVRLLSRMGSFRLSSLVEPLAEPVPVGAPAVARFPCPRPRRAGCRCPISPTRRCWVARGDGAPLACVAPSAASSRWPSSRAPRRWKSSIARERRSGPAARSAWSRCSSSSRAGGAGLRARESLRSSGRPAGRPPAALLPGLGPEPGGDQDERGRRLAPARRRAALAGGRRARLALVLDARRAVVPSRRDRRLRPAHRAHVRGRGRAHLLGARVHHRVAERDLPLLGPVLRGAGRPLLTFRESA